MELCRSQFSLHLWEDVQILEDEPLRFLANKPKAVEEEDEVILMIILQLYSSERNKVQSIPKYSHKLRNGTMQVTVFTAFVGRCADSGR